MSLRPDSEILRIIRRNRLISVLIGVALVSPFVIRWLDRTKVPSQPVFSCFIGLIDQQINAYVSPCVRSHRAVFLIETLVFRTRASRQRMANGFPDLPDVRQIILASDDMVTGDKKSGVHSARTRALAAVLVLLGIAVAGLLVIGVIVLLGHRMRRIARVTLPNRSQIDAFWYLRPKRSRDGNQAEPADAGTENSVSDAENSDE